MNAVANYETPKPRKTTGSPRNSSVDEWSLLDRNQNDPYRTKRIPKGKAAQNPAQISADDYDSDLARLASAWPDLAADVRAEILRLAGC